MGENEKSRRHETGVISALAAALSVRLVDRVSTALPRREQYRQDEGYLRAGTPDLVAAPLTTDEVSFVVRECGRVGVTVTPWGAGTSLEGNALTLHGGLCLDLSLMDRIDAVSREDLTATVQAGVRRSQLNAHLRDTGLYFPIDPGADATLGGMAATRASGTTAVKFGTMKHNVVSLTAVMSDGTVIRTGRQAPKSAAGLDLTSLLIGSEGTLAIITELTVKLQPVPDSVAMMVAAFPSLENAIRAVVAARQYGLDIGRIEFLDDHMVRAINAFRGERLPEDFMLFAEFDGSCYSVREQAEAFEDLIAEHGGCLVGRGVEPEQRAKLWKVRHEALYAARAISPGKRVMITDVCVPISRLFDCVVETRRELDQSDLPTTIAGHVGDGNFHVFIVLDPLDQAALAAAESLHRSMARRAIRMDGTCTGEHGIGLGKRDLLVEELGPAVKVMSAIKAALDPMGLFNPGKMLRGPATALQPESSSPQARPAQGTV